MILINGFKGFNHLPKSWADSVAFTLDDSTR